METALKEIAVLNQRAANVKAHGTSQYNAGWHEALDLRALLTISEAVARAALHREESRGGHARDDFQGEREDWGKVNLTLHKGPDGAMRLETVPREPGPPELVAIANANIEELEKNG